ncbi:MAG: pyridoxamine 5'-phosphate oxidase [Bacteroidales bacterium]|nr:pyridoxamine 5'-phosphate oxidase [Bacteroidales bacterium]
MSKLSGMRQEYEAGSLDETRMASDPLVVFNEWMEQAIAAGLLEPNAMTVATATADGKPSARVLLLKEVNEEGFVFFTNYQSRKGEELMANPYAALVFDWHTLQRQVRVEGEVEKLSPEASDDYFNSRPEGARVGAWVSPQSKVVQGREELNRLQEEQEKRFREEPVYRPPHWGGFLVRPTAVEFWQGRPSRLHDRVVYHKTEGGWTKQRLAP